MFASQKKKKRKSHHHAKRRRKKRRRKRRTPPRVVVVFAKCQNNRPTWSTKIIGMGPPPPPEHHLNLMGQSNRGGTFLLASSEEHCLPGPSSSQQVVPGQKNNSSESAIQSWASPVAGSQSQLSIPVQLIPPKKQNASSSAAGLSPIRRILALTNRGEKDQKTVKNSTAIVSSLSPSLAIEDAFPSSNCSAAGSMGSILASNKSRIFPSTRFFIALLLCLCYVSLSISTSNISVSMVCMTKRTDSVTTSTNNDQLLNIEAKEREKSDVFLFLRRRRDTNGTTLSATNQTHLMSECEGFRAKKHTMDGMGGNRTKRLAIQIEHCHEAEKLTWSSTEQGIVFAAQNAGSLLMLFTGTQADRLNSKWTITCALALLVLSNAVLPWLAPISVWLVVGARVLTGLSDALLQPSTSSLITRWFPPKERPFAIGLITGGRQIGTLLIMPLAGYLCSRSDFGWRPIFFLSALIGSGILFIWLLMSADKPSKHFCTSRSERCFVEQKIAEEKLGKRTEKRKVPWRRLANCGPLYVGVAALICHEYPLVIMLQLLPAYLKDVLHFNNLDTGIISAVPISVLFFSKTLSASASSYIQARKKGRFLIGRTPLVKWFNGIASLGLGICVGIVPLLHRVEAIVVLCLANAFAGLHTPGVQTALLQIAPAYTGIITGIAFGNVAICSIINKILSSYIVKHSTPFEWAIVFWISSVIALLPVFFFTIWGSADRQPWASTRRPETEGSQKRRSSRIFPTESGKKPGDIFAISNPNGKEQFTENQMEKGQREEEEEDTDSGHFESEAAVASALRLQMFLGNSAEEDSAEDGGDGGTQFLSPILQSHAAKVRQMLHQPPTEMEEENVDTAAPQNAHQKL